VLSGLVEGERVVVGEAVAGATNPATQAQQQRALRRMM
jgi:hypothetical protein